MLKANKRIQLHSFVGSRRSYDTRATNYEYANRQIWSFTAQILVQVSGKKLMWRFSSLAFVCLADGCVWTTRKTCCRCLHLTLLHDRLVKVKAVHSWYTQPSIDVLSCTMHHYLQSPKHLLPKGIGTIHHCYQFQSGYHRAMFFICYKLSVETWKLFSIYIRKKIKPITYIYNVSCFWITLL